MTKRELIEGIIREWEAAKKDGKDIFHWQKSEELVNVYTHRQLIGHVFIGDAEGD